jgi:DNA polymerase-4
LNSIFFFISQARVLTLEQLKIPFHFRAPLLYDWIRGIDPTPVTTSCNCKNLSIIRSDHEFSDDTNNADLLKRALYLMVESICKTLRNRKLTGGATKIILSYSDGLQSTSKLKLVPSTSNDMAMFKKCVPLLNKAWTRRVRIRHMRLICEKICQGAIQADLFSVGNKETKQAELILAMDKIHDKFGKNSIKAGLTMRVKND